MKPAFNRFLLSSIAGIAGLSSSAWAVDRIKQNNLTTLNLAGSWDTLPTSTDVALFDSTYATTGILNTGALVTWQGIRVSNPGGAVTINNSTSGQEVALGSSGIDMSAATVNLSVQRLRVDASQTWNVASGRIMTIGNSGTARTGVLSLGSGSPFTITKSGAGTTQLDTSNTAIGNVNWDIQGGVIRAIWNGSSAWGTGTITLGGGGIATGTNFTGSVGNWTWNNNISLTSSTSSFIDNQNIAGADRWLKLDSVISGSGNLEFRDTGTGFTNLDAGFIIAGTNTNTGAVTIASGAEVRVGGATAGTLDDIAGNNGKLAGDTALVTNNGTLTFGRLDAHTVANAISGSGNLRIGMVALLGGSSTSTQVVTLSGNNSYTGVTTVNNGVLVVASLANGGANSNIGASSNAASNLVFGSGGTLRYAGADASSDRRFTYSSTIDNTGFNIESTGAGALNLTDTNAITYAGSANQNRFFNLGGGNTGNNTLAAQIINNGTGATNLSKLGAGTWVLTNTASNYTGGTFIQEGTLSISMMANAGAASQTGLGTTFSPGRGNNTGTLLYTGSGHSTDRFVRIGTPNTVPGTGGATILSDGTGAMTFTSATFNTPVTGLTGAANSQNRILTLGGDYAGAANVIQGVIADNTASIGRVGLTKTGAGTWVLSGTNTYTGATLVNGGALVVNGNISTSLTTVASGATLAGTGTVGGAVVSGILSPGDGGIESLNINGNLTLDAGSVSSFEINTAEDAADLAIASALLTFGGTLNVSNIGGALVNGDVFNLFDWDTTSGTFSAVNLPTLTGGLTWDQSNLYTSGTIAVVPEPGAALLGGIGMLILLRRRRFS